MSSCLSGATGRAYGFDLDNRSSSPSSTLSESSNSSMAVFTRKPRTPRKRPNQTYNEAAALLSTACPTIFSVTKKNNKHSKLPSKHTNLFNEPPELLLPFPVTERPIKVKPMGIEYNGSWNCSSNCNSTELCEEYEDDFDTESILDEEIEEGIDSIMGNSNSIVGSLEISSEKSCSNLNFGFNSNTCYGYPIGLGFGGNFEFNLGFGLRNGVRALRNVDEGNWNWNAPSVNVMNISPPVFMKSKKAPIVKKKKVEELMKLESELGNPIIGEERLSIENRPPLLLKLKLNYNKILKAWSDKGSPLPEEISGPESPGSDIHAKLAQIDLFSEDGGVRETSVNRYKEKKRTRLYSKKIRYQVRKTNADRRPRSKIIREC